MVAGVLLKTSSLRISSLKAAKQVVSQCRSFSVELTEQQKCIQQLSRQLAQDFMKPLAIKQDIEGLFPCKQIEKLQQNGLMAATVSKEYGGLDLDYLSLAIAIEETSRACASTGCIMAIHNFLFTNLLNERGTDLQKDEFLRDVACKGAIGCFALSEPDAGTDVSNISTVAVRDGDHWVLTGKKSWVTSAIEGKATAVFATVDPKLKHRGLVCLLVPLDAEGVFRGTKEPLMGIRAVSSCNVTFDEVRVPVKYQVGEVGEGFKIAMHQIDKARIGISAHAVGIAQAALDTAMDHAMKRIVFGEPLAKHHAVKDRLTEMSILIESARLLTYRAATQFKTKNSSMAKYVAGRNAMTVADHCVQIMGGMGLSMRHDAQRHFRDARGTQIYGGVTDIQKRLIGQFLLKEYGL